MKFSSTLRSLTAASALAAAAGSAFAQDKPDSFDIGVFTFLSGPAAAYGMPGRQGAEVMIEQINAAGGIGGVPVSATFVDEAQGAEGVISEYRRLGEEPTTDFMIAALSSGNCLALAPIADQMKMPTVGWNCDTHQLFAKEDHPFFYRPNGNTIAEFMSYVLYFLDKNPDVKRVAIINPDYSFGHDAAEIVKATLKSLKPGTEVVAELFPKMGSSTYQTEISRLSAARPDVIFSNLWGGDLENFVRQAAPRGLFRQSQAVFALGESSMNNVAMPEGVIVGVLGDGWWRSPDAAKLGATEFATAYQEKYGKDPVFPAMKMANAFVVMKAAYEQAIEANGGAWPSKEQVTAAMEGMSINTLTGSMTFRADNDGIVDQVVGTIGSVEGIEGPVLTDMVRYDGSKVLPPEGEDPMVWIGSLTPEFLAAMPKPGSYK
ncbi:ABC transporter substrate-binding protein [Pseudodonghicola flavimaris]|uniref:ABC transporter substrate-binding protein n=1 Tax=Pseudodonghicola flavimaris TaxID=3050036 RepID=A0ABT7F2M6_9RHOB|nr:ABC transporter substrate-binding protein [Pseudodonghicola flavimaris]MDK3018857.1 ABC transporter substrate-binding protein [Pseudodonghicola flavimaris]